MFVAATPLAGTAYAQIPKTPAASVAQPASAAIKTAISTKSPSDWIIYDDTTYYTPVVDEVSRHLAAARKAFDTNDSNKAATEMRAVANELKRQATIADKQDKSLVKADKALLEADKKYRRDTIKRINASAQKVSTAAAAIESGKIKTKADLDKAIDKATRTDMERRWQVTDVDTWYPVIEEPQHHFTNAVTAYAKKDYKVVASEIHKATSYLRLEAARATGEPKQKLDSSVVQLDALSDSAVRSALKDMHAHGSGGTVGSAIEQGIKLDEHSMSKDFVKANQALALAHRAKAAEAWARNDYHEAGYELKAAAHGLKSASGWLGKEANADESRVVKDTRALGDKLASDASWTRDEVAKGFEALDNDINSLGHKIDTTN
ncbi:MAG: hypothetical protein WAO76_02410 [Georgfuchsia sp.]